MISSIRFRHHNILLRGSSSSSLSTRNYFYLTWRGGSKRNRRLETTTTTTQQLFQQENRREVTGRGGFKDDDDTDNNSNCSEVSVVDRQHLLDEAAALTKSLYRLCIRSTYVIRHGNAFDEKEFSRREEEFASGGSGGGILSMAPPPDREDELRSRTEYYQAYAREYLIQESDCLNQNPLTEKNIRRYLYYLKKGEKDRKWLLSDMMFPDPYKGKFDFEHVNKFEMMAMKYLGLDDISSTEDVEEEEEPDDDDDDYFDDEEEDPDWLKKKYPNLK